MDAGTEAKTGFYFIYFILNGLPKSISVETERQGALSRITVHGGGNGKFSPYSMKWITISAEAFFVAIAVGQLSIVWSH